MIYALDTEPGGSCPTSDTRLEKEAQGGTQSFPFLSIPGTSTVLGTIDFQCMPIESKCGLTPSRHRQSHKKPSMLCSPRDSSCRPHRPPHGHREISGAVSSC